MDILRVWSNHVIFTIDTPPSPTPNLTTRSLRLKPIYSLTEICVTNFNKILYLVMFNLFLFCFIAYLNHSCCDLVDFSSWLKYLMFSLLECSIPYDLIMVNSKLKRILCIWTHIHYHKLESTINSCRPQHAEDVTLLHQR